MAVVKSRFGLATPRIEQPVRPVIIVVIQWLTSLRNKVYLGDGYKEVHAISMPNVKPHKIRIVYQLFD